MAKPNITQMIMPRNYVLRTTKGHSIQFTKNEPIYIPTSIVEDALAVGAAFVDEGENEKTFQEPEVKREITGVERDAALIDCFKMLETKNDSTDWTASGMPSVRAVEIVTGLSCSTKEIRALWTKYLQAKGDENAGN